MVEAYTFCHRCDPWALEQQQRLSSEAARARWQLRLSQQTMAWRKASMAATGALTSIGVAVGAAMGGAVQMPQAFASGLAAGASAAQPAEGLPSSTIAHAPAQPGSARPLEEPGPVTPTVVEGALAASSTGLVGVSGPGEPEGEARPGQWLNPLAPLRAGGSQPRASSPTGSAGAGAHSTGAVSTPEAPSRRTARCRRTTSSTSSTTSATTTTAMPSVLDT